MRTELLPCPFCGHATAPHAWTYEEMLGDAWIDEGNGDSFSVVCNAERPDGPGGCGGSSGFFTSAELAIEAWNRRAKPAPAEQVSDADLQKEHAELAAFVVEVGGFWGDTKSRLTGPDSLAECLNAAVEKLRLLEAAVTSILLGVVPGWDGMGQEVYAKSVEDVENALSKMGEELEEWQLGIRRLPAPLVADASEPSDTHAFKNFHRALCERFDYSHDEVDWRRDQVSLIEHIAKMLPTTPTAEYLLGHEHGLEWAAQQAEANDPRTGDWLFDDPHLLAAALRKGPEMPVAAPQPEPLTDAEIKRVFIDNGFTVKPGEVDLKPYVYKAGRELICAALSRVAK